MQTVRLEDFFNVEEKKQKKKTSKELVDPKWSTF